jgi:two-component system LytT family response regulator
MVRRKIRALIVDDEPAARKGLRLLLERDREIRIVGECENGAQAVAAIGREAPDLLFLDVQMPGMSGFDVLRRIDREQLPVVVFVTAYDQYALQAFDEHALDYLLKPFSDQRFTEALERAKDYFEQQQMNGLARRLLSLVEGHVDGGGVAEGESTASPAYLQRVAVKSADRVVFVEVPMIDWLEARGDYVALHVGSSRYTVRGTMKDFERKLDPRHFARIHRSAIVNLDRVRELQPYFHGEYVVLLQDGTRLRLSRRRREQLERQLGQSL